MSTPITLIFTKGAGKHDQLAIVHADGTTSEIACPKQRIIPHDMVHYAVESVLDARGFLGRVRDGEAAAFTMAAEAQSDAVERLVEVFQGDAWSGGATSPDTMIDLYRVTCAARGCPALPIDATVIDAVRSRIAELDARWACLDVGDTLQLTF